VLDIWPGPSLVTHYRFVDGVLHQLQGKDVTSLPLANGNCSV
jgi:hypothetical protein